MAALKKCWLSTGLTMFIGLAICTPNSGASTPLSLGEDISGLCTLTFIECMVLDIGEEGCSNCRGDSRCFSSQINMTCQCWDSCTSEEECYECASCFKFCEGPAVYNCKTGSNCTQECMTGNCNYNYQFAQMGSISADCGCN